MDAGDRHMAVGEETYFSPVCSTLNGDAPFLAGGRFGDGPACH